MSFLLVWIFMSYAIYVAIAVITAYAFQKNKNYIKNEFNPNSRQIVIGAAVAAFPLAIALSKSN